MADLTHIHEVVDRDLPFVIDPITLKVTEQSTPDQPANLTIPKRAKNSLRFSFTIPDRYIEGHDMSEVNQTLIHYRNIDAKSEAISAGIYKVQDLKADGDSVTLSWLIGDESTYYAGGLLFSIHFACVDDDGNVVYNLPTLTYSKITVGDTVWNSEDIAKKYPDIIAELESRISALESGGGGGDTGGGSIAALTGWEIVQSSDAVTLNYTLEDGSEHTDVITLDANGYPVSIAHDGVAAPGAWREADV